MKLAFIITNEYVFVTKKSLAEDYALYLKANGHEISKIVIAPLGSSIMNSPEIDTYNGVKDKELSLAFLRRE
jgi:hypothetical protein